MGRLPCAAVHHPWWFALPAIVVFGGFFLLPNLLHFFYPFTDWSSYHPDVAFTGLDNFRTIAEDGSLLRSLRTTLLYAALFQNGFGLGLALLLEADTRFNRFFRAVFFLLVLISALAVGYVSRPCWTESRATCSRPPGSMAPAPGGPSGRCAGRCSRPPSPST